MNLRFKTSICCSRGLVLALAVLSCVASATPQASSIQNVIVYHEDGRFAGWPANRGIWSWDNEIAVGFVIGGFKQNPDGHSRDPDVPIQDTIGRSLDGGVTWKMERLVLPKGPPSPVIEPITFTHPDFAYLAREDVFYVSYDRARTWRGPFPLPGADLGGELTARTDYVVNGPSECLFFLSVDDTGPEGEWDDRAYAARTRDGGKTFDFLGWMTGEEEPVGRAVMPSTVRAENGTLVTTLRRKYELDSAFRDDLNWIDAFISRDDGTTWEHSARIAHTDHTGHNGNPPSLVRLSDDRLVAAYAVRYNPYGVRARVSEDNGLTWGPEIILRDDSRTWDIGYCQSTVRADGRIVTVYYYATPEHFENHIAATIWSP